MADENYFVTKEKLIKLLKEENQGLKEKIKTLEAYNEQMQNENSYLGEQVDIYKEGYEVSKEKINKLEAKLEAYKEILRSVLKALKEEK